MYVYTSESWMKTFVHNATSYSMIEIFYKFRKRFFSPIFTFEARNLKYLIRVDLFSMLEIEVEQC